MSPLRQENDKIAASSRCRHDTLKGLSLFPISGTFNYFLPSFDIIHICRFPLQKSGRGRQLDVLKKHCVLRDLWTCPIPVVSSRSSPDMIATNFFNWHQRDSTSILKVIRKALFDSFVKIELHPFTLSPACFFVFEYIWSLCSLWLCSSTIMISLILASFFLLDYIFAGDTISLAFALLRVNVV